MSNFVNIRIGEDLLLEPSLDLLVRKLVMVRPSFMFKPRLSKGDGSPATYANSCSGAEGAPNGKRYLHEVNVYDDNHVVGLVGVGRNYGRTRPDHPVKYEISSWRIDGTRGDRNKTVTVKVGRAVALVKKYFFCLSTKELNEKNYTRAIHEYDLCTRNLMLPIDRNQLIKSVTALQKYVYRTVQNLPVGDRLQRSIDATFTSESYIKAMGEYDLGRYMLRGLGHPIGGSIGAPAPRVFKVLSKYGNDYLYFAGDNYGCGPAEDRQLARSSFEELHPAWQDRLAVLQLVKDNELVRDVGFRVEEGLYVIVYPAD
jgi:hypothetical protein